VLGLLARLDAIALHPNLMPGNRTRAHGAKRPPEKWAPEEDQDGNVKMVLENPDAYYSLGVGERPGGDGDVGRGAPSCAEA
jgi:hypothetical protein